MGDIDSDNYLFESEKKSYFFIYEYRFWSKVIE